MVLASSSVSAESIAALVAVAVFVVAGAGGFATYFVSRRTAGGRVGTSEASVLWQQAQKMRAELEAQRDKAVEQRDRLIESQTSQVLPVLLALSDSLRQITESLARLEGRTR